MQGVLWPIWLSMWMPIAPPLTSAGAAQASAGVSLADGDDPVPISRPALPAVPEPAVTSSATTERMTDNNVHAAATPIAHPKRLPIFGVGLDVGVPDGANLSLVARPCPWARVHVAMGNNSISYGWRFGATLLPLRTGPAFVVEYGHYRDGNANPVAGKLIGSSFEPSPLFERVGYDYVNLHLGLNFGYRRFVFFVQGGLSILRGQIHNADQAIHDATAGLNNTDVSVHSDPTFKATGFAGKLGVIAYVW